MSCVATDAAACPEQSRRGHPAGEARVLALATFSSVSLLQEPLSSGRNYLCFFDDRAAELLLYRRPAGPEGKICLLPMEER